MEVYLLKQVIAVIWKARQKNLAKGKWTVNAISCQIFYYFVCGSPGVIFREFRCEPFAVVKAWATPELCRKCDRGNSVNVISWGLEITRTALKSWETKLHTNGLGAVEELKRFAFFLMWRVYRWPPLFTRKDFRIQGHVHVSKILIGLFTCTALSNTCHVLAVQPSTRNNPRFSHC